MDNRLEGRSVEDRRLRSGGGERWCLDWVVEVDLVKDGKYQADSKWVCPAPRLEMPQTG